MVKISRGSGSCILALMHSKVKYNPMTATSTEFPSWSDPYLSWVILKCTLYGVLTLLTYLSWLTFHRQVLKFA